MKIWLLFLVVSEIQQATTRKISCNLRIQVVKCIDVTV